MGEQNYKEFWNEAMSQIHKELKSKNLESEFLGWYAKMEYAEDSVDTLTIAVPSKFMWDFLNSKGIIRNVEAKLQELGLTVKILHVIKNIAPQAISIQSGENPIYHIEKPDAMQVMQIQETQSPSFKKHPDLMEEYTFDTFVMGENSKLAYSAALGAAENPGKKYNPILIYGSSGLGKTHLMQAIGNYIYKQSGGRKKIRFIQAKEFTNEFTFSIRNNTIEKFQEKYQKLDALLVDDIHYLEGKIQTNEELYYIFNELKKCQCQMVFTCDRPIETLQNIAERLTSRISSGLTVDLQIPDFETRKAILQKKMELRGTQISDEIIDYIAYHVQTNVRDLEQKLTLMYSLAELMDEPLTLELAKQKLKFTNSKPIAVSVEMIQSVVAEEYRVTIDDLKGKKRNKPIMTPRAIAIYLCRKMTQCSFDEIGSEFGGRDHSTIMNSYNKIEEQLSFDSTLNSTLDTLKNKIIGEIK